MALCVCAATGVDQRDALSIVAASDDSAPLTFEEAHAMWAIDATPLQVDTLGERLMLIEPNGWRCTDATIVGRLSTGGRAASVYWNVNALMRFVYADHGEVLRDFDPLLYEPRGALAEEEGLPFGHPGRPGAAAFVLLEQLMSVGISAEWLTAERRPTYWVNPTVR